MSALISWFDRTFYPTYKDYWDAEMFRRRLLQVIGTHHQLLDYGAGRGSLREFDFKGHAARVAGVDVSDVVQGNPFLDESRLLTSGGAIPYPEDTFDIVFATNVMEHVEDPAVCFREVSRVLKPGGLFLFKTTNKWHYVAAMARLTPTSFHSWFNRLRGREERDTFPTFYRCNTVSRIVRYARIAGLNTDSIELSEGRPEYLRLAAPLYFAGCVYERLVNSTPALSGARAVIIATLSKPGRVGGR